VNWILRDRNRGGGQTGQSKPPTKFFCIILDFQKNVMRIYVSCETPEEITDYRNLYFSSGGFEALTTVTGKVAYD